MRLFRSLRRGAAGGAGFDAPLAPDGPFLAVGDIHGRADLLDELLPLLGAADTGCPLVFAGDYVDRGEDAAGVLSRLREMTEVGPRRVICLRGNHEDMLLRYLEAPAVGAAVWLANGGLQTLASFGLATAGGAEALRTRDALAEAMGADTIRWLRDMPLTWTSGNVTVAHAGADPNRPLDRQKPRDHLWGHPDFLARPRGDGQWLVHGHWIRQEPEARDGRIAIDTGAFATGRLTAAHVSAAGVRFLGTG